MTTWALGAGWTVVLPLKGGAGAKSRLAGPPQLARALALDTLAAARDCRSVRRVVVVTGDATTARDAVDLGAGVVAESVAGAGLPGAVAAGVRAVGPRRPVAVLLGDLPALRAEDLAAALEAARQALRARRRRGGAVAGPRPRAVFVPDADGTGTVLLAGLDARHLAPAFGEGSAAAHEAAGARRLDLDLPRLRRDVDTTRDLTEALELGAGPATAALVDALRRDAVADAGDRAWIR